MNFSSIIGNNDVKRYLEYSIEKNNFLHSYLFCGTEGIGKSLIAKEFAKKILCIGDKSETCTCKSCTCFTGNNHPDYDYINKDGESVKIEIVRNITEKVIEKPIISLKKVYIINDCEKMTKEAQNCLLKTLEEPPEFVVIILISSNENLILNTIKSRCMIVNFQNILDDELKNYAIKYIGYDFVSDNLLKSFDGSIGKAIKLKDNKDNYLKIEQLILNFDKKDIIDIMLDSKIIYDKENIYDILDYIIVFLYSNKEKNYAFINCVKHVNKCILRLKSNCNFDMSVDTMLFEMWREINENSNRS